MPDTNSTSDLTALKAKAADVQARLQQAIKTLQPNDIAVDCGANVGAVTKKLASRGCRVHAFEPDPVAFARLVERFGGTPNVVLHNAAVGATSGSVKLFMSIYRKDVEKDITVTQSSSIMADKSNVSAGDYVEVEMIDFCGFVEALPGDVALLKMDIEGAEADILRALIDRGLVNRIKTAFVETHEERVPSTAETMKSVRRDLAAAGATHFSLDWL